MTSDDIEAERLAFERIMSEPPYEFEMDRLQQPYRNGEYRHYHTKCAWDAWQERAAIAKMITDGVRRDALAELTAMSQEIENERS